jgi:polyribonucleotide nucleotidyltransferase
VLVKVLEIDDQGRLNLSRRDALIEVKGLVPENDIDEEPKKRDNNRRFNKRRNND